MKSLVIPIFAFLLALSAAQAQIELVPGNYFPAELEFSELQSIASETSFEDPARLPSVEAGSLFSDVGFIKYARRVYSLAGKGSLSIEIVTLLDSRAAYSLTTLLRGSDIQNGPPGDFFAPAQEGTLLFSHGKRWVRIKSKEAPPDLLKRVALSVSNRIGPPSAKPPSLVTHFPKTGYDRTSLRYYPSVKTFDSYVSKVGGRPLRIDTDAEIAQARYTLDNRTGVLSLLSFPTKEVAEEYFTGLSNRQAAQKGERKSFVKRAGPIVGILEGPFDSGSANQILGKIQYTYSIKWVYEDKPKTVWGIPGGILTTVVKSLFFVVILFGFSILAGIGFAFLRRTLKKRAPKRSPDEQDPDEMTRLKMR